MKKILLMLFVMTPIALAAQQPLKLWYRQPAKLWTQALPLGNGRLGAMVFGNPGDELIQLNESTLWSGGPVSKNVNPNSASYLPKVREAIFAGDYKMASELSKKMQGVYSEGYLPLGDMRIKQTFNATPGGYYRDLNIRDAIATTRFTVGGVTYKREVFTSAADQVIVVRLTAGKPGMLTLSVSAGTPLLHYKSIVDGNLLLIRGKAPSHVDPSYLNVKRDPLRYDDTVCKWPANNCSYFF